MAPPEVVTLVLADDSAVYRAGMVRAIRAHPELELLAEVESGEAAVAKVLELQPDVALLDLRMPGIDGIEVCQRLAEADSHTATRCLLLSAYVSPDVVRRAFEAGASGFLSKSASRREICAEVLRVGRGEVRSRAH